MNPQRCLTNLVGGMGECLACGADQGEACRPGAATSLGQDMYLVGPQLGVAPPEATKPVAPTGEGGALVASDQNADANEAPPARPLVWMNQDHLEAYRNGTADGIAWASPKQTEFYDSPLFAGMSVP